MIRRAINLKPDPHDIPPPDTLGNPLLAEALKVDRFIHLRGAYGYGIQDPNTLAAYMRRRELAFEYAWAIPNPTALEALVALSPLVEIGAGTGYWKKLLAEAGADVVAYDKAPYENNWVHAVHSEVLVGGSEMVIQHPGRALFMCWPIMGSMAVDCVRSYSGAHVAYIGEPPGGCTADDAFFELLEAQFTSVREVDLPQWYGIHDYMTIYRRKA